MCVILIVNINMSPLRSGKDDIGDISIARANAALDEALNDPEVKWNKPGDDEEVKNINDLKDTTETGSDDNDLYSDVEVKEGPVSAYGGRSDSPLSFSSTSHEKTRVLFITSDVSFLDPQAKERKALVEMNHLFDEMHIMVLTEQWQSAKAVKRIAPQTWLYTTASQFWWQFHVSALSICRQQLVFAEGFRPDVIVALEPFSAGFTASYLAKRFKRPYQVQMKVNPWSKEFKDKVKYSGIKIRFAEYVLGRSPSVCVASQALRKIATQKVPKMVEPIVLPPYYDMRNLLQTPTRKESGNILFPQFSFVILYMARLGPESTLFRVLDSARNLLHNPGVVLFVVGDGPMKKHFQERAQMLGISRQVIFKQPIDDPVYYFQNADIFFMSDTNPESDEMVIKAAAAGLPLLLAENQLRRDLFTDGEDVFMSVPEDTVEFSQKLNEFVNNNAIRAQFREGAREVIAQSFHEDPAVYQEAYLNAIESVLYTNSFLPLSARE